MASEKEPIKLEDLVVLQYSSNDCSVKIIGAKDYKDDKLEINPAKETWSYDPWQDNKIGSARYIRKSYGSGEIIIGLIGVYDRNNTSHLNKLLDDALGFVEENPSPDN